MLQLAGRDENPAAIYEAKLQNACQVVRIFKTGIPEACRKVSLEATIQEYDLLIWVYQNNC